MTISQKLKVIWSSKQIASIMWKTLWLRMKSWLIPGTLSAINQQELWMIKGVDLSGSCSSFTPPINSTSLLNGIPLTPSMPATLQELLIQNDHHLLSKGTPCQNQLSSMTKTRQSRCLKKSWICDIQNQIIVFSTRFAELTATLILLNITQMAMSSETCWKLYRNTTHITLISQIHSLLNWSWFTISQQRQAKKKSETQSQKLFQAHYSFLTESSFQEHRFWASKVKLVLKMGDNIEGGFLLKQHLPYQSNTMTIVFPKLLKLSVINHTHSALATFEIRLAYDSSLKSQKPC